MQKLSAHVSFFQGISAAKGDILQFCTTLQALDSTMQSIKSLSTDPDINHYITPDSTACLKDCFAELEAVDAKCRKVQKLV